MEENEEIVKPPSEMTTEEKASELIRMKEELGLYVDRRMIDDLDPHEINSQYKHYYGLFNSAAGH